MARSTIRLDCDATSYTSLQHRHQGMIQQFISLSTLLPRQPLIPRTSSSGPHSRENVYPFDKSNMDAETRRIFL